MRQARACESFWRLTDGWDERLVGLVQRAADEGERVGLHVLAPRLDVRNRCPRQSNCLAQVGLGETCLESSASDGAAELSVEAINLGVNHGSAAVLGVCSESARCEFATPTSDCPTLELDSCRIACLCCSWKRIAVGWKYKRKGTLMSKKEQAAVGLVVALLGGAIAQQFARQQAAMLGLSPAELALAGYVVGSVAARAIRRMG